MWAGWPRVAKAFGGGLKANAASLQFKRLSGRGHESDGARGAPGCTLPAAVLERLVQWFDIVGEEPWDSAGAEALVKKLNEELEHETTASKLRAWFYEMRSFTKMSQGEWRELVDEINAEQPIEEQIATTHKGVFLLQGGSFGFKGVRRAEKAYSAAFTSGGKQENHRWSCKEDAALWYTLRCAERDNPGLADREADILKEVLARSVSGLQERKEARAKKKKEETEQKKEEKNKEKEKKRKR